MAFKGFRSGVLEDFNSWHLPTRIVEPFKRWILDLEDKSPTECSNSSDGIFFVASIVDSENLGDCYHITLRICRNDEDFWVADINGFAVDHDDKVFWTNYFDRRGP